MTTAAVGDATYRIALLADAPGVTAYCEEGAGGAVIAAGAAAAAAAGLDLSAAVAGSAKTPGIRANPFAAMNASKMSPAEPVGSTGGAAAAMGFRWLAIALCAVLLLLLLLLLLAVGRWWRPISFSLTVPCWRCAVNAAACLDA
jgi:hypothetical protein